MFYFSLEIYPNNGERSIHWSFTYLPQLHMRKMFHVVVVTLRWVCFSVYSPALCLCDVFSLLSWETCFIFICMVKNLIETEKTCKLWLSTWIYNLVRHVIFAKVLHIWYFVNVLSNKQFWYLKLQNSMFAYEETISCLTRRTKILWNHNLMQLRRVIPLGYKVVWWN